jgi:uncharacterized phiE125 gp8 family phage protein
VQVAVITPPVSVVPLDIAKRHLRVEADNLDDDLLIQAYAAAATSHIDGPNGWLGRAIGVQTLEASFDRFACDFIRLPYPPITAIVSVKYDDTDEAEQTLAPSAYELDPEGVLRIGSEPWPTAYQRRGSVRVRYAAGFEVTPPAITAALLLMTGDLYANRETGVVGTVSADIKMSTTVKALLDPYRAWSV